MSPEFFKYHKMQELALMSQITVAHAVLIHNKQDLTLSKLTQDILQAKGTSNLKHNQPFNPIIFQHPTEQFSSLQTLK
jgi:DNA-directed RNA polymerase delta subunit